MPGCGHYLEDEAVGEQRLRRYAGEAPIATHPVSTAAPPRASVRLQNRPRCRRDPGAVITVGSGSWPREAAHTHTDSKNSSGTALPAIISEIEVVFGRDEACGLMHAMPYVLPTGRLGRSWPAHWLSTRPLLCIAT